MVASSTLLNMMFCLTLRPLLSCFGKVHVSVCWLIFRLYLFLACVEGVTCWSLLSYLQVVAVPDLFLTAVKLRHDKTGAQYLHAARDDSNNLFR